MISNSGKDENRKYHGGKAGDQGGEWNIINWYNRPWNCVLRHPDEKVRKKLAELSRKSALNDKVGYDQYQRNTYWTQLQKVGYDPAKITVSCEADCSAGVIANTKAVGHLLGISELKNLNATYTGNMRKGFKDAGFTVLTASKYLTSDKYLLEGDILLNDNAHTAVNLDKGAYATSTTVVTSGKLEVDESWGVDTTTKSQKVFGTSMDGEISNQPASSKKYLPNASTASWEFKSSGYKDGSQFIKALQEFLKDKGYYKGNIDGWCGKKTVTAMQEFLRDKGFYTGAIDGSMGKLTVKAWQNYINSRL